MESLLVKKWGGENAAELKKSPSNVANDFKKGNKQVIVVSAIRTDKFNTTDKLIRIGLLLKKGNKNYDSILSTLDEIKKFHLNIIKEKLINTPKGLINLIIEEFRILDRDIHYYFENKTITPDKSNDYIIDVKNGTRSILGFGEELSAKIHNYLINNLGIDNLESEILDLNYITENIDTNKNIDLIFLKLSIIIAKRLFIILEKNKVPVISGYIPGFETGIENVIGRGFSDATAGITSVGLSRQYSVTLEVQKSVRGILSSDPRFIKDKTAIKLIDRLDYTTAKEIIGVRGAQAKLLNYQVLRRELQESEIEIHLFNPFNGEKGTIISNKKDGSSIGVEFIGGRKNIAIFTISSGKMCNPGILFSIFGIIKKYTSVDIISTSETEISFTIDNNFSEEKMDIISNTIRKTLNIEKESLEDFVIYTKDKALIYCIGQNLKHSLGSLAKAATALANGNINIEMVSQGRMERAMVFCIDNQDYEKAINLLHNTLIQKR